MADKAEILTFEDLAKDIEQVHMATSSAAKSAVNQLLTLRNWLIGYYIVDILSHTIREIIHSRVVVVNINGRNPNVFYELGICHTIGKPVIIISSLKDEIPFDVISKSIVIYKDIDSLKNQLKDELLKLFIDSSSV